MTLTLLDRAKRVKENLLEYGITEFSDLYITLKSAIFPDPTECSEEEELAFNDWFVFEHLLEDQRTVLSHFIETSEDEADILVAEPWHLVIQGVFQVKQILPEHHYQLHNLVNDVSYLVSTFGRQELPLEKGEYIFAKIIPFQNYHLFTGVIDKLPTRKKNELYALVAEIQAQHPRMAFIDNLQRLETAYEIQADERKDFITFFGSDEIFIEGSKLQDKMKEFYHYRYFQKKQDEGSSIAKIFQDKYHQLPQPPVFDIPNLDKQGEIGVIYDAIEGMVFLLKYQTFKDIFQREDFKRIKKYKQLVMGYLKDPNISSLPFKRMAQAHPENAEKVFQTILKRKKFRLDKDLEALLKKYKPMESRTHLTPAIIPSLVKSKTFLKSLKVGNKW